MKVSTETAEVISKSRTRPSVVAGNGAKVAFPSSRGANELSYEPDLDHLRCPSCLGELSASKRLLACSSCKTTYPLEEGIVDLRAARKQYYFNPVKPEEMESLVRAMTPDNWPATIRRFIRGARMNTSWLDNVVVDGRYAWKLLLNLNPDAVVLDLGCGLGNLTHNIAPFVRKTYALDLTYLRLLFSKNRFAFFNPDDDISLIAGGDGEHLPFCDASLDCVIMSGVLEWVGEGDMSPFQTGSKPSRLLRMLTYHFGARSPRQIQLHFLREIRRVLKPGGQIFVAIENRLNYEYFAGRPDHHSGLKYGSLLPRFAANLYSIAASRAPYRTYTYSLGGYQRLLREAGFPNVEFLGLTRGYSHVDEILPADVSLPAWRPEPSSTFKDKIRRNKRFHPAYGIVGSASPRPWRRLQDELLAAVERDLAQKFGTGEFAIQRYLVSGKDKLMLESRHAGNRVMVKVPLNRHAQSAESQNHRMLCHLAGSGSLNGFVPAPLGHGTAGRLPYFIEERLPGAPLAKSIAQSGRAALLPSVGKLLDALHSSGAEPVLKPLSGDLFTRVVAEKLDRLLEIVEEPDLRKRLSDFFYRQVHGIPVAVGLFHGDFGTRNILAQDGRLSGAVDWEAGSPHGLPLLDVFNYLTSMQIACNPRHRLEQIIPPLASGEWPVADEWALLRERYRTLGMDPIDHSALTYLYWLHCVDMLLPSQLQYDPVGLDRQVNAVIRSLPN